MTTTSNPMTKPTTKPQSERQNRKNRKEHLLVIYPMEMIEAGWETLEALYQFRGLQSRHISQMFFLGRLNSDNKIREVVAAAQQAANRNCLSRLKDLKYIETIYGRKIIRKNGKPVARSVEMVVLTKLGYDTLQDYRIGRNLKPHPPYKDPTLSLITTILNHWLQIIEGATSLYGDLNRRGLVVEEVWIDDKVRSMSKKKATRWSMEPDCLLLVRVGDKLVPTFIEADNGTESIESDKVNSLRNKAKKYREFFIRERHDDHTLKDLRQPIVCFIVPSKERMINIKNEFEAQGGRQAYWFTTYEWLIYPLTPLGKVWQVIGREGFQSPLSHFEP